MSIRWIVAIISLLVTGLGGIVVGALFFLFRGISDEGTYSMVRAVMPEIVQRAIQVDRLGEVGIPENSWENPNHMPHPWRPALDVLMDHMRSSHADIDCSLPITLEDTDPREFGGIVYVLDGPRPLRFVALFKGPIPDFEAFLTDGADKELMGPIPFFSNPGVSERDLREHFADFQMNSLLDDARWRAEVCNGYSFFEYRGL